MAFTTEQHRQYQGKRRLDRLALARERLGSRCAECNETENLDFDHIDPRTKLKKISEATNWSLARFLVEVDKCQLLCRTHHIRKSQDCGDLSGGAKLVTEDIKIIRTSGLTTRELAEYYQVDRTTIWKLRSGRTWKYVP